MRKSGTATDPFSMSGRARPSGLNYMPLQGQGQQPQDAGPAPQAPQATPATPSGVAQAGQQAGIQLPPLYNPGQGPVTKTVPSRSPIRPSTSMPQPMATNQVGAYPKMAYEKKAVIDPALGALLGAAYGVGRAPDRGGLRGAAGGALTGAGLGVGSGLGAQLGYNISSELTNNPWIQALSAAVGGTGGGLLGYYGGSGLSKWMLGRPRDRKYDISLADEEAIEEQLRGNEKKSFSRRKIAETLEEQAQKLMQALAAQNRGSTTQPSGAGVDQNNQPVRDLFYNPARDGGPGLQTLPYFPSKDRGNPYLPLQNSGNLPSSGGGPGVETSSLAQNQGAGSRSSYRGQGPPTIQAGGPLPWRADKKNERSGERMYGNIPGLDPKTRRTQGIRIPYLDSSHPIRSVGLVGGGAGFVGDGVNKAIQFARRAPEETGYENYAKYFLNRDELHRHRDEGQEWRRQRYLEEALTDRDRGQRSLTLGALGGPTAGVGRGIHDAKGWNINNYFDNFMPPEDPAPGYDPRDGIAPEFDPRDTAPSFDPREGPAPEFDPRDGIAPEFDPRDTAPSFDPREGPAPEFDPRDNRQMTPEQYSQLPNRYPYNLLEPATGGEAPIEPPVEAPPVEPTVDDAPVEAPPVERSSVLAQPAGGGEPGYRIGWGNRQRQQFDPHTPEDDPAFQNYMKNPNAVPAPQPPAPQPQAPAQTPTSPQSSMPNVGVYDSQIAWIKERLPNLTGANRERALRNISRLERLNTAPDFNPSASPQARQRQQITRQMALEKSRQHAMGQPQTAMQDSYAKTKHLFPQSDSSPSDTPPPSSPGGVASQRTMTPSSSGFGGGHRPMSAGGGDMQGDLKARAMARPQPQSNFSTPRNPFSKLSEDLSPFAEGFIRRCCEAGYSIDEIESRIKAACELDPLIAEEFIHVNKASLEKQANIVAGGQKLLGWLGRGAKYLLGASKPAARTAAKNTAEATKNVFNRMEKFTPGGSTARAGMSAGDDIFAAAKDRAGSLATQRTWMPSWGQHARNWIKGTDDAIRPSYLGQFWNSPLMDPVRGGGTGWMLGSGIDIGTGLLGYETDFGSMGLGLGALARNPFSRRMAAMARRKALDLSGTNPVASQAYHRLGKGLQGARQMFTTPFFGAKGTGAQTVRAAKSHGLNIPKSGVNVGADSLIHGLGAATPSRLAGAVRLGNKALEIGGLGAMGVGAMSMMAEGRLEDTLNNLAQQHGFDSAESMLGAAQSLANSPFMPAIMSLNRGDISGALSSGWSALDPSTKAWLLGGGAALIGSLVAGSTGNSTLAATLGASGLGGLAYGGYQALKGIGGGGAGNQLAVSTGAALNQLATELKNVPPEMLPQVFSHPHFASVARQLGMSPQELQQALQQQLQAA